MRILLTGGAGFIGSQVAEAYLNEGHDVVILDDLSTGFEKNLPSKSKFYRLNIADPKVVDILVREKPDLVNHHASRINIPRSVEDPAADAAESIVATISFLENCRKNGAKKFIFSSSGAAIYGDEEYFPAGEKSPTNPRTPYGIGKLTIEKYLQFYRNTYGTAFTALRYANIYGPRQNAFGEAGVVAIFAHRLMSGEPIVIYGDGNQTRDFTYVGDIVRANLLALEPNVQGIFNLGTGVETTVNQLVSLLEKMLNVKASVSFLPERAEQRRSCLKPSLLQNRITPLKEGLQITLSWFQHK